MRFSSVLWKGFIRRGKKSGLEFPRGVKGREGFLSTGTGVQSDQSWARLRKNQSFRLFSHTDPRENVEKCHKSESAGEMLLPCQKLSMQIPVRLTLRPNKVAEGRSKRPSGGW